MAIEAPPGITYVILANGSTCIRGTLVYCI